MFCEPILVSGHNMCLFMEDEQNDLRIRIKMPSHLELCKITLEFLIGPILRVKLRFIPCNFAFGL